MGAALPRLLPAAAFQRSDYLFCCEWHLIPNLRLLGYPVKAGCLVSVLEFEYDYDYE